MAHSSRTAPLETAHISDIWRTILTAFLAVLHRRHGLTSRSSLSSSIDSSLDCPTRLRFRGGRRGSTSESTDPRKSLFEAVGSEMNE
jgi:hypothetical protein